MNRCPITYECCSKNKYSSAGLKALSKSLANLKDFPYSAEEQRQEAVFRASKMSIQGVQPKLSTRLNVKNETFEIVDQGGQFILKPQNILFSELPQNEDLTMRLARLTKIEIPLHGMIYSKDGSLTYFIKRFDRVGRNKKMPLEDFAQLAGKTRDTKYDYSMEKLIKIIDQFCTFPAIEKVKLFRLVIFNFLIGNEDMHLKNFSLLTRDNKVALSPAYDLINTTIALKNSVEELALPLNGKKNKLKREDFFDYFAVEKLQLTQKSINSILTDFNNSFNKWQHLIKISFLSETMKNKFFELVDERCRGLDLSFKLS